MNEFLVTVVVSIYNSGKFLNKGLESILNQTWSNLEVLMMDDGSTDNSGLICDEYAVKDNRFIAVHKFNTGVCDSRNRALDIAKGDYVCFMDGDDWFAEDFVEYMMYIIEKTQTSMAISDHLFTTDNFTQIEQDNIETWDYVKTIKNIIYPYMVLGPWNKIYSMKIIKKYNIRFPEHWFGETLHFANTVAYYVGEIGVGHKKVYNYRLNNINSGTTQFNVEYRMLSLDNAIKLCDCIFGNEKSIKHAINWHLYENYFNLLLNIIATNSEEQYSEEYKDALAYLRHNCFGVFMRSEINLKQRIAIIIEAFFPREIASHRIKKHNERLENISRGATVRKLA